MNFPISSFFLPQTERRKEKPRSLSHTTNRNPNEVPSPSSTRFQSNALSPFLILHLIKQVSFNSFQFQFFSCPSFDGFFFFLLFSLFRRVRPFIDNLGRDWFVYIPLLIVFADLVLILRTVVFYVCIKYLFF